METLLLAASLLLPLAQNPSPVGARPLAVPTVGVPFGCGHSFYVSQAHETGSHLQNDAWAWDFRMPSGTPVVAAMDGEVRLSRGDSTQGGCDAAMARHANYVVLTHEGGLETQYLHFSSVVVRPGQKVRRGELIGYSGETGWSCGAHLHFKLARTQGPGWNNPSVPANIEGYGDPQRNVLVRAPVCTDGAVRMASLDEQAPDTGTLPALQAPAVQSAAARALLSRPGTAAAAASLLEGGVVVPASGSASLDREPDAPAPLGLPAAPVGEQPPAASGEGRAPTAPPPSAEQARATAAQVETFGRPAEELGVGAAAQPSKQQPAQKGTRGAGR